MLRPFYRLLMYFAEPWHRSFDRMRRQDEIEESHEEEEEDDADDIEALIDVGEAEGIIEEEERELIQSAIEFGDTTVGEIMTPRTEMSALPKSATVRDARRLIIESRHSRLPVYRDQIDNVEGIIYLRDLLPSLSIAVTQPIRRIVEFMRPFTPSPETKPSTRLLREMQKVRVYMAIRDRRSMARIAGSGHGRRHSWKRLSAKLNTRTSAARRPEVGRSWTPTREARMKFSVV